MAAGIAEGSRRQWKPESIALFGGLLPIAAAAAVAGYYFVSSGKEPLFTVEEYLRGSITEAAKFYTKLGFTEMTEAVKAVSDTFIHYLVRLIPAIMISTSVLQAVFCYAISRSIISRRTGAGRFSRKRPLLRGMRPTSGFGD